MNRHGYALSATAEQVIERGLCLWLLALVATFVLITRHWPMAGDATFMHYVIFLMKHGMVPYRDIVDMNLPGSYLLEGAEMRLLGPGSIGWRLYDFALMLLASVSLLTILRREGGLAGILAAALFVLIHGRDGILMSGERDFAGAVLLLAAVACLFAAMRLQRISAVAMALGAGFGAPLSLACCIKPTFIPMVICLLIWTEWMRRERSQSVTRVFVPIATGLLLPVFGCFDFLLREGALLGFSSEMHGLIPYHASIDPRSFGYLLDNCLSPVAGLFFLWLLAAWMLRKQSSNPERTALIFCAVCGLLSYLLQRKGFWYQRYPLLAFLLPVFMIDFSRLVKDRSWPRLIGIAGFVFGIVLASLCVVRLAGFERAEPQRPLLNDLSAFGPPSSLSGHVQCMDTIGGCLDALYAGGIVQSTGFLYDCYLLGGRGADRNGVVIDDLRRHFWQEMALDPPRLVVVTDSVCYEGARSFDKYARWPEFQSYLASNFDMVKQSGPQAPTHYWSRLLTPYGYRIYMRRTDKGSTAAIMAR
ncbi:hypothetical protein HDF16_000323 [Granulicella aggregans]|uniref:Dolichyl-phosphate-mannose-protein mannosyltransferase n=1 Tax=Granulicella aggregans TaxID=474949 RepID=A0A7W8E1Z9_9BACT|nr:hypothetical protein [Granulicella aggregans]MBB5055654.1 hypothetical protein [Granulicella aggregans]